MHGDPALWSALLQRLAGVAATFLRVQVGAGAAAVQLFDSWAGALSAADYAAARAAAQLRPCSAALADLDVPEIHFGVGTGELLAADGARRARTWSASTGGCRWTRRPAGSVRTAPCRATSTRRCCWPDWPVVEREVRRVLAEGRAAPGHVFNLGHGVLPQTDPDVLTRVVELVHAESAGRLAGGGSGAWSGTGPAAGSRRGRRAAQRTATAAGSSTIRNGSTAPSTVSSQPTVRVKAVQPSGRPPRKPARSTGGAAAARRAPGAG